MTRPSVYEYAGGEAAFLALAAAHHARCLADTGLNHPFSHGVDPHHVRRLGAYWAEVFGGPDDYSRRYGGESAMLGIHAGQGIGADLGERFAACFSRAADDAGLPADPELRACLDAYMRCAVGRVLEYSPPGSRVPQAPPTPRWSWDGPQPAIR